MTEMKKCYLKPETDVLVLELESMVAATFDPNKPGEPVNQDPSHNPWLNPTNP